jgi:hypothetical protein
MGCPVLCDQVEGWHEGKDGKESRDLPQHVCSSVRYVLYGMHDVYQDSGAQSPEQQEVQRLSQASASAPGARPFSRGSSQLRSDHDLAVAHSSWRARI